MRAPRRRASLALNLYRRGTPPSLGLYTADALFEHASKVAVGENLPPDSLQAGWTDLVDCVQPEAVRTEFQKRVIRFTVGREGDVSEAFFKLYGNAMANPEALASNEDVLSRLFSNWLMTGQPQAGLRWMHRVLSEIPQFWEREKSKKAAEEFLLRLRDRLANPWGSESDECVAEIGKILGIEVLAAETAASP